MLIATIVLLIGCLLLAWGADRFVTGAAVLARFLGVSPLVIGIVLVGFATSLPEMIVSGMAAWQGNPVISIGNAIGSNITNIGLAIGIAALIKPLFVRSRLLTREYPVLIGVMLFDYILLFDGTLSFVDGLLMTALFIGLIFYMTYLTRTQQYQRDAMVHEAEEAIASDMKPLTALLWWLLGFVLLLVSSRMLIYGAVTIAQYFGVSDLIIGLTIVALGTSLPEIAASVVATIKNEPDMALGNVIGSNIFNLLPVLIMPAVIAPTKVPAAVMTRDYPIMILMTALLLIFSLGLRIREKISRPEGGFLVILYLIYTAYLVFVSMH